MADEIDMAEDVVTAERDAGIARVRAALSAPSGVTECEDCFSDIPPARRAAMPSAVRCAACQGIYERTHRG
jgi:phage/conjugal plasmid C-4 type zinc finger TraR family protein